MKNQIDYQESTLDYLTAKCDISNRLKAIYAAAFFLVVLLMFSASAHAGYSVSDSCYGDTASAAEAFRAKYPVVNDLSVVNITSLSVSATGLLTFVLQRKLHTSAAWTNSPSSTLQLPTCTSGLISTGNEQNMIAIALMVLLFVFGFALGKNMFNQNFPGGQS